jgi:progressive ankylosis protein
MLALMAFTPVGTFVLNRILGVSGEVAEGARSALAIFVFLPFFTGFRGFFQGLVIKSRRTGLVSFATGMRVLALLFFLFVGSQWFNGPALGAFALLMCIVIEAALMGFFAWRFHLKEDGDDEKSTGQILRFALPLAFSSGIQQTIPVVIAAIIGRLPDATLALAAFGVVRGLLFLLAGPMRNIQQAYLTLVQNRSDYATLIRFFLRVGVGMGLLTLLVAFPFNQWVLGQALGLDEELRRYISLPLACCAIYPLFYGLTNLLRGYFTGEHLTGLLGRATLYKFLYLLFCWLAMQLLSVDVPGISVAIFLLISSEILEMSYLRYRRKKLTTPSTRLAA